jgi:protein involved in polysaccharide export with SLBB domain
MSLRLLFQVLSGSALLVAGSLSFAQAPSQPPRAPASSSSVSSNYKLLPNDVILLRVFQEDDLTGQYRISQDGTATFPLIGPMRIGGQSVETAARAITGALKRYLNNPQVNISVAEYSKRRFIVLGQVQRPGTYLIPNEEPMDLLTAIAAAGGYTRFAEPGNVIVKRQLDGREVIYKLNAKSMAKREQAVFEILPDDKITVGERVL